MLKTSDVKDKKTNYSWISLNNVKSWKQKGSKCYLNKGEDRTLLHLSPF